jgi:TonB family protein
MSVTHPLAAFVVALCITAPSLHGKEERKSTVYNYVGTGPGHTDEPGLKPFYERFNVVNFTDDHGYTRSKCTRPVMPRPVWGGGFYAKGSVSVAFVVTSTGRVIEPVVLRSTDRRLDNTVLETILRWRGTPALLNGRPIAILLYQDFTFP